MEEEHLEEVQENIEGLQLTCRLFRAPRKGGGRGALYPAIIHVTSSRSLVDGAFD